MAPDDAVPAPRCRNCGAPAADAYCPCCGQETRARLPTLREFTREAAGRYVALDGTLWRTLGGLLARPGFLTREYLAGRRRRFVRPFRLYLGASLLCFLVVGFAIERAEVTVDGLPPPPSGAGTPAARSGPATPPPAGPGAKAQVPDPDFVVDGSIVALPGALKPAGEVIDRRLKRFVGLPSAERMNELRTGMRHNAPYAMFVLVPAFALLLKLAYPRSRRLPQRPGLYGEHLVFAVHNHAFLFVALTLIALLPQPFAALLWAWVLAYFVLALRAVYGGGWPGTLLRGAMLFVVYVPLVAIVAGLLVVAVVLIG